MCIWSSGNATAMNVSRLPASPRLRSSARARAALAARWCPSAMYSAGIAREGVHQRGGLSRPHAPDRVVHAVVGPEVVERRVGGDRAAQAIDRVGRLVGQEDDAGLRAQLDDVPRAIVFLVGPRALVLLDDVLLVLVHREARRRCRSARGRPCAAGRSRATARLRRPAARRRAAPSKFAFAFRVDLGRVRDRCRPGRSISERVTCRKLSGLPAASCRASSVLTTS